MSRTSDLSDGRKECVNNLETIKKSIRALLKNGCKPKQPDSARKDLKTCADNIWFLESILDPPEDDTKAPVISSDYRHIFIFNVARNTKFDGPSRAAIQKMSEKCSNKGTANSIDLFVNLIITTGLELYVASEDEFVNFLLFISKLYPLTEALPEEVALTKTGKCPVMMLSLL